MWNYLRVPPAILHHRTWIVRGVTHRWCQILGGPVVQIIQSLLLLIDPSRRAGLFEYLHLIQTFTAFPLSLNGVWSAHNYHGNLCVPYTCANTSHTITVCAGICFSTLRRVCRTALSRLRILDVLTSLDDHVRKVDSIGILNQYQGDHPEYELDQCVPDVRCVCGELGQCPRSCLCLRQCVIESGICQVRQSRTLIRESEPRY